MIHKEQQDLNHHWNVYQMNLCIPLRFPCLCSVFQTVLSSEECGWICRLSMLSCTSGCHPDICLSPKNSLVGSILMWCNGKIAWNMPLSEVPGIVSLRYLAIFSLKHLSVAQSILVYNIIQLNKFIKIMNCCSFLSISDKGTPQS